MNFWLSVACITLFPGFGEDRVQRFALPESRVVPVLVHPLTTTTVRLPGAILGYDGLGFSQDPTSGGEYYLRVLPREGLVTVGVWSLPSPPRNLQVHLEEDLVTLLMIPVEEPGRSLFQLHLLPEPAPAAAPETAEPTDSVHHGWWESDGIHYQILRLQREDEPEPGWLLEVEVRNPDVVVREVRPGTTRFRQGEVQWRARHADPIEIPSRESRMLHYRWSAGEGPQLPEAGQLQIMFSGTTRSPEGGKP